MTLTETRPDDAVSTDAESQPIAPVAGLLGTGDHVVVGRAWVAAGSVFLLGGLVAGLLAAIEHADVGGFAIVNNSNTFTQLWSASRVLLLLGGIVPILIGLAISIVPLQVGSSGLAFARGAAASFWTWLLSVGVVILAYVFDGGPGGNDTDFVVLWALAMMATAAAIIWALVCIATTVLGARAQGMTLERVPVATWGFFVFSISGLLALPVMLAELLMAYLDTKYGYLPTATSRSRLVGVMDTISIAPALYWVVVPTLGLAVQSIAVHTGRPIKFHKTVLALLGVIAFCSYGADVFSFSSRGRALSLDNGLMVVAILAVAVLILAVLGAAGDSMKGGKPKLTTPLAAGLGSGLLLLLGAAVSEIAQVEPIVNFINTNFDASINLADWWSLNGTSFHEGVRGLILGAAVLGAVGGVHHFAHKVWGRSLNAALGLLSVAAIAVGTAVWGLGGVGAGFAGQPTLPLVDLEAGSTVELFNVISVIGVGLIAAGVAIFVLDLLMSLIAQKGSATEPWRGVTLEWATSSPPARGNFETAPVVTSATPLADDADGEDA